jgi:hypothetical protein
MARCTLSAASEALDVDALGWKRSLYDSDDVVVVGFWDQGGRAQEQGVRGNQRSDKCQKSRSQSPHPENAISSLV